MLVYQLFLLLISSIWAPVEVLAADIIGPTTYLSQLACTSVGGAAGFKLKYYYYTSLANSFLYSPYVMSGYSTESLLGTFNGLTTLSWSFPSTSLATPEGYTLWNGLRVTNNHFTFEITGFLKMKLTGLYNLQVLATDDTSAIWIGQGALNGCCLTDPTPPSGLPVFLSMSYSTVSQNSLVFFLDNKGYVPIRIVNINYAGLGGLNAQLQAPDGSVISNFADYAVQPVAKAGCGSSVLQPLNPRTTHVDITTTKTTTVSYSYSNGNFYTEVVVDIPFSTTTITSGLSSLTTQTTTIYANGDPGSAYIVIKPWPISTTTVNTITKLTTLYTPLVGTDGVTQTYQLVVYPPIKTKTVATEISSALVTLVTEYDTNNVPTNTEYILYTPYSTTTITSGSIATTYLSTFSNGNTVYTEKVVLDPFDFTTVGADIETTGTSLVTEKDSQGNPTTTHYVVYTPFNTITITSGSVSTSYLTTFTTSGTVYTEKVVQDAFGVTTKGSWIPSTSTTLVTETGSDGKPTTTQYAVLTPYPTVYVTTGSASETTFVSTGLTSGTITGAVVVQVPFDFTTVGADIETTGTSLVTEKDSQGNPTTTHYVVYTPFNTITITSGSVSTSYLTTITTSGTAYTENVIQVPLEYISKGSWIQTTSTTLVTETDSDGKATTTHYVVITPYPTVWTTAGTVSPTTYVSTVTTNGTILAQVIVRVPYEFLVVGSNVDSATTTLVTETDSEGNPTTTHYVVYTPFSTTTITSGSVSTSYLTTITTSGTAYTENVIQVPLEYISKGSWIQTTSTTLVTETDSDGKATTTHYVVLTPYPTVFITSGTGSPTTYVSTVTMNGTISGEVIVQLPSKITQITIVTDSSTVFENYVTITTDVPSTVTTQIVLTGSDGSIITEPAILVPDSTQTANRSTVTIMTNIPSVVTSVVTTTNSRGMTFTEPAVLVPDSMVTITEIDGTTITVPCISTTEYGVTVTQVYTSTVTKCDVSGKITGYEIVVIKPTGTLSPNVTITEISGITLTVPCETKTRYETGMSDVYEYTTTASITDSSGNITGYEVQIVKPTNAQDVTVTEIDGTRVTVPCSSVTAYNSSLKLTRTVTATKYNENGKVTGFEVQIVKPTSSSQQGAPYSSVSNDFNETAQRNITTTTGTFLASMPAATNNLFQNSGSVLRPSWIKFFMGTLLCFFV